MKIYFNEQTEFNQHSKEIKELDAKDKAKIL